jgi:Flp pilus assembly protein TadG
MNLLHRFFRSRRGSISVELALMLTFITVPTLLGAMSYSTQVVSRQNVNDSTYMVALAVANDPSILSDVPRWNDLKNRASALGVLASFDTACMCAKLKTKNKVTCTGNPCGGKKSAQYKVLTITGVETTNSGQGKNNAKAASGGTSRIITVRTG